MPSEPQDSTDLTLLLAEWRGGDAEAGRTLISAVYRELASAKGHDAFLVEWDQLGVILSER